MDLQPVEKNKKAKANILYVDDNEANLIVFKASFQDDYNVFTVKDGNEGLELLGKDKFAVIVSDQRMPGMTGIELLEVVKIKFPDVMRFILTAYTSYDVLFDAINKGQIYGFFNKPINSSEIKSSLDKAIEVYNLRESNKKVLKDLERANMELLEIDRSKTRLLNAISEEIRTPINKMMSTIYLLKDKLDTNELIELLNHLDTSVSRLERFSNLANQLGRLTEGNQPIPQTDISLKELVEVCILEKKEILDEKCITIELAENEKDIIIKADYELLVLCLTNLIVNSVNHSDNNGIIKISIWQDNEHKYVEIIDQGLHYTTKELTNLAGFFKEDRNAYDYTSGIEMVLVKKIMATHGGKIEIIPNDDKSISTKMVFKTLVL